MKQILNLILRSKIYNNLHNYIGRRLFKLSKIFFVDVNFKKLPTSNHPLNINYEEELQKYKITLNSKNVPYISYSHLIDLLKVSENFKKKKISFLDYGAGNLQLFATLNKNIRKLEYFYSDQLQYNQIIKKIKNNEKIKNLSILDNMNKTKKNFDFIYFGASLQYLPNYRKSLNQVFKKTKIIIISQSPFYFDRFNKRDIVLKQLNLSKTLNYLYLINFFQFIKFMNKNKFYLMSKNYNRVIKFLNFKNLKNNYKDADMYDLLFKKK